VLKLVKLLYMAERCHMEKFDEPMFYDKLVSMDYGPVPSVTLNLINGMVQDKRWSAFMGERKGYDVSSHAHPDNDSDLDNLSQAELSILKTVWDKFSGVDRFDLAEWTHNNCPEWESPNGSSKPISHEIVFKFLNKESASELEQEIESHRHLKRAIGIEE